MITTKKCQNMISEKRDLEVQSNEEVATIQYNVEDIQWTKSPNLGRIKKLGQNKNVFFFGPRARRKM